MNATKTLPDRKDVDPQFTWNTASLFGSEADFEAESSRTETDYAAFAGNQGKLTAGTLYDLLENYFDLSARLRRLGLYASLPTSADATDQQAKARLGRFMGLASKASAATAWLVPELLAAGRETLADYEAEDPRLGRYRRYFDRLEAQREHVRSSEIELLLGSLADAFGGAGRARGSLVSSDISYEPVVRSDGSTSAVAPSTIDSLLGDPDREVRRQAFCSYADAFLSFRNTLTDLYATRVKQAVFSTGARNYGSTVEEALAPREVPRAALDSVVRVFQRRLPVWHRYWSVRRRLLGVAELEPWDVFAPLSRSPLHIPYSQSVEWITESVAPLGEEYVSRLERGLKEERWVDVYPNRGKREGAFAAHAPGSQPFIMMSYDNGTGGLSTLAHELGHAMHAQLTMAEQPVVYGGYSMVVAETASNLNQALLFPYLLDGNSDPEFQIAIIEEALYNLHRYFFIMPTLARFELAVHGAAERGEGLTADRLNQISADLFREGYGSELAVDERTAITWAQFQHLYVPFYTFQYACGVSAAAALGADLRNGVAGARERVLGFLASGDHLDPIETLRRAGVDLTTDDPIEKAFDSVEYYINRLEELADQRAA